MRAFAGPAAVRGHRGLAPPAVVRGQMIADGVGTYALSRNSAVGLSFPRYQPLAYPRQRLGARWRGPPTLLSQPVRASGGVAAAAQAEDDGMFITRLCNPMTAIRHGVRVERLVFSPGTAS